MSVGRFELGEYSLLGNRQINQDRCIAVQNDDAILLGLADGMGGHPRGEKAAEILTETCTSFFEQNRPPVSHPEEFLTRLLQKAHENLTAFGLEQTPAIDPRTTAVVVLIQHGVAHWAHVGDSRLYLFRSGKPLKRTVDHSYVERLQQSGMISEEERQIHPHRNYVTRCLGGEISVPDIALGAFAKLHPDDVLLLCSDGLWSQIKEEEMAAVLARPEPLKQSVTALVQQAEESAFPESDNVTAIALRWLGEQPATIQPAAETQPHDIEPEDKLNQAIDELKNAIEAFESNSTEENP
jgi:serine/threonine protein phosphatase PrpC